MNEEQMVTIRLDSGEIVEVPLAYIEPHEPESEGEGPDAPMEVNEGQGEVEWAYEDMPAPRIEDPTVNQATSSWITSEELSALADFDTPAARQVLWEAAHFEAARRVAEGRPGREHGAQARDLLLYGSTLSLLGLA